MAFSEFELYRSRKILANFCKTYGPPLQIRHQVAWGYYVDERGQNADLFEIRPDLLDTTKFATKPFARAKYIKSRGIWKIYWRRGKGKWAAYEPCPYALTLDDFLKLVREDSCGCFFG
ncbi:MAG: DUF3024 domain-containing protein [Desulfovibrio sp.]|uniref:DUF3024 domain-containing protein n=1 Tax=Desulfovibrio sp. 7SRBS1 TaxID=3378064 RepID=UPI003B3FFBBE